jgi:hypothetical protein
VFLEVGRTGCGSFLHEGTQLILGCDSIKKHINTRELEQNAVNTKQPDRIGDENNPRDVANQIRA